MLNFNLLMVEAKPVTTSLKVADYFEKNHRDVLRDIRNVIDKSSEDFGLRNFAQSSYLNEQGKEPLMSSSVLLPGLSEA